MNILETIVAHKRREVEQRKRDVPVAVLEQHGLFKKLPLSLKQMLKDASKTGIIAEYKRASPSKGVINNEATVEEVIAAYVAAGASGISVLTDNKFFGGSLADLSVAVQQHIPVLRKDFMIDPYQIVEAKAYGASVILLIAACLSPSDVKELTAIAKGLQLEVLLELHDESELDHVCDGVDLVGINNRNLKTFSVDLEQSIRLAEKLGGDYLTVAESGINSAADIQYLKAHGFDGFLIGERFMKEPHPGAAFKDFVTALNVVSV